MTDSSQKPASPDPEPQLHAATPAPRTERFPATHWSVISEAGSPGDDTRAAALNLFIQTYWKPIFCFLRARGFPVEKSEELTQEFMLRLMEENWLQRADRNRGRFRNFILRILVRFLADLSPERTTRQRSFEGQLTPVSSLMRDEDRSYEPTAGLTPEEIFERRWAISMVQQIRDLLEASYALDGKQVWYDIFAARYLAASGEERLSETELGEKFGLSRDQVRHIQQHTKTRFLELLQYEARCQTGDDDVNAMVRELLELAAGNVSG